MRFKVKREGIPLVNPLHYKFGSVKWKIAMEHNIGWKLKHHEELSPMEKEFIYIQTEKYGIQNKKKNK